MHHALNHAAHHKHAPNETRLNQLFFQDLFDTGHEAEYDKITELAQQIFNVPIVLITLIRGPDLWFKSSIGLERETVPRSLAFCDYTIRDRRIRVSQDTLTDPRFSENILVTGKPHVRFYAGTPLRAMDGSIVGTLCLLDSVPHPEFGAEDRNRLKLLGNIVGNQFKTRYKLICDRDKNRAKTEYISHVAHEVRNPLSAIVSISDILGREKDMSIKAHRLLNTLDISAHNLLDLVNSVLDMSKIESRHITIKDEPFQMSTLFCEIGDMMDFCAAEKGLGFYLNNTCHADLIYQGDKTRIRQVLMNLIGNAVKFTEYGGIALTVQRREIGRKHKRNILEFIISDTGCGMTRDESARVFEPFYQTQNAARQNNGSGSGLGLAITKEIVEAMDGKIQVKSTPGQGTTFTVRLPDRTTPLGKTAKNTIDRPRRYQKG